MTKLHNINNLKNFFVSRWEELIFQKSELPQMSCQVVDQKKKKFLSLTVGYKQDMHIHFLAHLIPLIARLSPSPSSLWKYFWISKVNINSCQQKSSWLKPLATLQQLYINGYSAVRYCQEKSGQMILQWNFCFSLRAYLSVTTSASALSCYYSKLFSPFFQELMSANHLNPKQLLKRICLVLCSFEFTFHITLLDKHWWNTASGISYVTPLTCTTVCLDAGLIGDNNLD